MWRCPAISRATLWARMKKCVSTSDVLGCDGGMCGLWWGGESRDRRDAGCGGRNFVNLLPVFLIVFFAPRFSFWMSVWTCPIHMQAAGWARRSPCLAVRKSSPLAHRLPTYACSYATVHLATPVGKQACELWPMKRYLFGRALFFFCPFFSSPCYFLSL